MKYEFRPAKTQTTIFNQGCLSLWLCGGNVDRCWISLIFRFTSAAKNTVTQVSDEQFEPKGGVDIRGKAEKVTVISLPLAKNYLIA